MNMQNSPQKDGLLELIPLYEEEKLGEKKLRRQADVPGLMVRAYRKAGPVFRMNLNQKSWVVLAGPEANQFVWTRTELWNYPIMFPAFLEEMGPDHLNVLEGDRHTHKRNMLKPAMDQASAVRHLPGFDRWFRHELARRAGPAPIDLIEFWAEAIIKANAESVSEVSLSDAVIHRLAEWEARLLAGIRKGEEERRAHYSDPEYVALKAEAMAIFNRIIEERLADPGDRKDRFGDVLKLRGAQEGGYPERQFLIDDLYYVVLAGAHNTAFLINWIFLYLYFLPEWRDRVKRELESWDGHDLRALGKMNHLKAVILEIQRLRPPIHFTLRHSTQVFEFAGLKVPADTDVLCASTCCHFLEEIYPDPFEFKPERFLEVGKFAAKTNGFFGGGVHICVGRNYAMMQAPLAIARMLKDYDITYGNEPEMRAIMEDIGSILPDSIPAVLRRRDARNGKAGGNSPWIEKNPSRP
jgi:cytochrome P450